MCASNSKSCSAVPSTPKIIRGASFARVTSCARSHSWIPTSASTALLYFLSAKNRCALASSTSLGSTPIAFTTKAHLRTRFGCQNPSARLGGARGPVESDAPVFVVLRFLVGGIPTEQVKDAMEPRVVILDDDAEHVDRPVPQLPTQQLMQKPLDNATSQGRWDLPLSGEAVQELR
eukprot:scaffold1800_cov237-Pinguiococcus_pyrenoidosus.AAC.9